MRDILNATKRIDWKHGFCSYSVNTLLLVSCFTLLPVIMKMASLLLLNKLLVLEAWKVHEMSGGVFVRDQKSERQGCKRIGKSMGNPWVPKWQPIPIPTKTHTHVPKGWVGMGFAEGYWWVQWVQYHHGSTHTHLLFSGPFQENQTLTHHKAINRRSHLRFHPQSPIWST
jgi:hypothetical protein